MNSTGPGGSIRSMAGGYVRKLTRRLIAAAIVGVVTATLVVVGAGQSELVSVFLWLVVWVTVFGLLSGLLMFLVARRALRTVPEGRIPAEVGVVYAAVSLAGVWIGSVGLSALIATALVAVLGLDGFVAAIGWIGAFVVTMYITRIVLSVVTYTTMITQLRGLTDSDDSIIGRARSASAYRRARPVTNTDDDTPAAVRVVSPGVTAGGSTVMEASSPSRQSDQQGSTGHSFDETSERMVDDSSGDDGGGATDSTP